jgi:hypothetical protein
MPTINRYSQVVHNFCGRMETIFWIYEVSLYQLGAMHSCKARFVVRQQQSSQVPVDELGVYFVQLTS